MTEKRRFGPMTDVFPLVGQGTADAEPATPRRVRALRGGIARRPYAHRQRRAVRRRQRGGNDRRGDPGLPRRDLFIVSKVLPHNASHGGTIRACEQSLRRLGTIPRRYLCTGAAACRWPTPWAAPRRIWSTRARSAALGVSNFDIGDLEEGARCSTKEPDRCNEVQYHLGVRHIDTDGSTTARSTGSRGRRQPVRSRAVCVPGAGRRSGAGRRCARHGATPRQVALAFLEPEPPLFTIPKASAVAHAEENAARWT